MKMMGSKKRVNEWVVSLTNKLNIQTVQDFLDRWEEISGAIEIIHIDQKPCEREAKYLARVREINEAGAGAMTERFLERLAVKTHATGRENLNDLRERVLQSDVVWLTEKIISIRRSSARDEKRNEMKKGSREISAEDMDIDINGCMGAHNGRSQNADGEYMDNKINRYPASLRNPQTLNPEIDEITDRLDALKIYQSRINCFKKHLIDRDEAIELILMIIKAWSWDEVYKKLDDPRFDAFLSGYIAMQGTKNLFMDCQVAA